MSDSAIGNTFDDKEELAPTKYRTLRIWPPSLLLGSMLAAKIIPRIIENGPPQLWMLPVFGPLLCGTVVMIWWLVGSRATWRERLFGFLGVIASLMLTLFLVDKSMQGPAVMVLTIPMGIVGFAVGAIVYCRLLSFKRTLVALMLAFAGFGFSTLLRSDGMWGDFALGLHWRWQLSPEQRMMAVRDEHIGIKIEELSTESIDLGLANPEWPEFRGADRTGRQRGQKFATDWSNNPPEQIWKIQVGPAWSSFVVAGDLLFTQEQRGPYETVVCYESNTGREVWARQVEVRFDDPLGGPGPRATPTLAAGGLYVSGAAGDLLRLEPKTGEIVWSQDLAQVAQRSPPMWGFSSSPLVVGSVVIAYAGGPDDKGILGFDTVTGELKWSTAAGKDSYCSPQLCEIAGEQFVVMVTNTGMNLLDPETGSERLDYKWPHNGYRALQPQVISGDSVLLATGMGTGTRCVRIVKSDGELSTEATWTTNNFKPDFNDFVLYQDYIYGFDAAIFTCLNAKNGERQWKGGRYGKGQVVLLEDSGLLLIASEKGEVVLLNADPTEHVELGKFQALDGKTWNHPVVVGDRLYIRNAAEAACYRLPL